MKKKVFIFIMFLSLGPAGDHHVFGQEGSFVDLNLYKWKNRLLLVFSSSSEDSNYQSFTKAFQDQRKGLKDRDILVFEILEKGPSRLGDSPIKKDSADSLRKQFGISPGQFCMVLVGKDGEEKRRWQSMVGFDVIFSVVDAMPMRQREIKEKR